MESGALGDWLGLDEDPDITVKRAAENRRKVEAWWQMNRGFIERASFI